MVQDNLVGQNVIYKGRMAKIRYHGPIDGRQGMYFGLDWFDLNGKHSGNGYFKSIKENSASFVSDQALIDRGISFYKALVDKYTIPMPKQVEQVVIGNKVVEMIGVSNIESKLSNLARLEIAGLADCKIGGTDCSLLNDLNLGIKELDLSKNLFSSFEQIGQLLQYLPNLELLRLNYNWIEPRMDIAINIKILSVSHCKLSDWSLFSKLAANMPDLKELYIGYNEIEVIENCPSNLVVLDLEGNLVSSFDNIKGLARTELESLNLKGNCIEFVPRMNKDEYPNLQSLNLAHNRINDWRSINNLNYFPTVSSLRLNDNPITLNTEPAILVGRLANIKIMSGSLVTKETRQDYELYYLKMAHADRNSPDFDSLHFRYEELCKEYGAPVSEKPTLLLNDKLLTITISSITKRIPKTMNIRSVKTMFSISQAKSLEYDGFGMENSKNLAYYEVENGAILKVLD